MVPSDTFDGATRTEREAHSRRRTPQVAFPRHIGPYRILLRLGEGGMGIVYLAKQSEPVERLVALKVVKSSLHGPMGMARFQVERQAMARLSHPNVAQLYEAGSTEDGSPFFAMEFVPGWTLTDYCDTKALPIEERLRLFVRICHGLQHAHQKGILHRDLKPSNLLVTVVEGEAVPKLIDFGIAKALDEPSDSTDLTGARRTPGTPTYMSPEAGAGGADLDTRTDVYSLGLVLYELLAGVLPLETRRQRLGSETPSITPEQVRPSNRVSGLGETTGRQVAERRRLKHSTLARRVQGDLDWIVLRAIAEEPDRRYASAAELAADIERHLTHQPVTAGPPSLRYRAGKFVRRHRAGVAAAALVALALVLGVAGTSMGLVRARQAERQAVEQAARADREAEAARRVSDFLTDVFEVSDPGVSRGNEVTARELLDNAADRIETQLHDQPLVRARMMHTLGRVYSQLGLFEQSESLLDDALSTRREELGGRHPEVAESLVAIGRVYREQGRLDEAIAAIRAGPDIQRSQPGSDPGEIADALYQIGFAHYRKGQYEAAETEFRRALALAERAHGPASPEVARLLNSLSAPYADRGLFAEAEQLSRRALQIYRATIGDKHRDTAVSLLNLARKVGGLGRLDEAITLQEEALATLQDVLGPEHPTVRQAMSHLGYNLFLAGRHEEARPHLERALQLDRGDPAVKSGLVASRCTNLGLVYCSVAWARRSPSSRRPRGFEIESSSRRIRTAPPRSGASPTSTVIRADTGRPRLSTGRLSKSARTRSPQSTLS